MEEADDAHDSYRHASPAVNAIRPRPVRETGPKRPLLPNFGLSFPHHGSQSKSRESESVTRPGWAPLEHGQSASILYLSAGSVSMKGTGPTPFCTNGMQDTGFFSVPYYCLFLVSGVSDHICLVT